MKYYFRHAEKKLLQLARNFKAVLVLGARQVGKTTLLTKVFPNFKHIVFDPIQDIYGVREDPDLFLKNFPPPIILYEVQFVPELLPSLKRFLDKSNSKGQYFLTGSQNLSVLRSVSESMAGRIGIIPLSGLTTAETTNQGNKKVWLATYLKNPYSLLTKVGIAENLINLSKVIWRGSLPGLLDIEDEVVPDYLRSYINTYIERDVRLLENIQVLSTFGRFIALAAALTAQEININQLGREIGITPLTAKKWLALLNNTYQWLELFPYHNNSIKRLSSKRKGFFCDTGLACHLQRISSPEALACHPKLGAMFETWVINDIHKQFLYISVSPQTYHWRTSAGAEVDLVLEQDGKLYPIEIKCKTVLNKHDTRGIRAFRETYTKQKIMPGLIIYAGDKVYEVAEEVLAVPWNIIPLT